MMPGMIMLWYGSVATIPSGWHLCDGSVGTPNLSSKFIMCTGGPYTPGGTGGLISHNHDFTGDGHSHDLGGGNEIEENPPSGVHQHQTTVSPATGTTDARSSLPPYYVLCYIMKLPIP